MLPHPRATPARHVHETRVAHFTTQRSATQHNAAHSAQLSSAQHSSAQLSTVQHRRAQRTGHAIHNTHV
eukprot:4482582-Pyramimonas_sp.AAC.1